MKMPKSFPKGLKTLWGKEKFACYEQFLLFPQCFQKTCTADTLKQGLVWERIPKQQILDSSKLKEFADDNFKFDENGRKFSKCIENIVGKGEIARQSNFSFFQKCFQDL